MSIEKYEMRENELYIKIEALESERDALKDELANEAKSREFWQHKAETWAAELVSHKAELETLLKRFNERAPLVPDLQAEISKLKAQLTANDYVAAKQNAHMNDLLQAEKSRAAKYRTALEKIKAHKTDFGNFTYAANVAREALREEA